MWTIKYGRGHLWDRDFETRREAMLAWIRSVEAELVSAPDDFVLKHWTSIRKITTCTTAKSGPMGNRTPRRVACKASPHPSD
jgi:hypothetical protein